MKCRDDIFGHSGHTMVKCNALEIESYSATEESSATARREPSGDQAESLGISERKPNDDLDVQETKKRSQNYR